MNKIDIKSLSKKELETGLEELGTPKFRASQIFRWFYKERSLHFDDMKDLPAGLRDELKKHFHITHMTCLDSRRSRSDGTTKYLLKLEDGNTIETVFLPEKERSTICLSTQVGCRFGCVFCASAKCGFVRNLAVSEILEEVLFVMRQNPGRQITNLVFMGIGEPLDNYDNLMKAVRILNDKDAFGLGARRITISSCGIIPGIKRLQDEGLQVELSISLHSADDAVRTKIVPVNKKYPLKDLIECCREYIKKTGRVITFEYVMMKGVNISKEDVGRLAGLLGGINCKVNLISYNQIRARGYEVPTAREAEEFAAGLKARGINVTRRKSKGEDIDAGCGQLRISKL